MCKRFLIVVLGMGVWVAGPAVKPAVADDHAWSSPFLSADVADTRKLLADRTRFVQEMYQLSPAESSKILQSLNGLATVQDRYQMESALTLDRLRLAITLVGSDPALSDADRQEKITKFQGQFHRILAKAPLSLQNVIKLTEAGLSTEAISAARARIAAKFSQISKISGIPFAIENLDALACGPIHPGEMPDFRVPDRAVPAPAEPPPTTVHATPVPAPAPPAVTPLSQRQPRQRAIPAPNIVQPPSMPNTPVPPAPPMTQWSDLAKQTADKFDFTPDQRSALETVIQQSQARAEDHRKRNQAAYDQAAKLSDEDAKMKKLQELNKPLDIIFDTMQKRIDSIASIEQHNKAAQKKSTK